jgi:hypothetical protein
VADIVDDADAANAAGTAALKVPRSLTQIFSKEPDIAATEKSGQDQGRVHSPLGFSERHLSLKRFFKSSEFCHSPLDALADVDVRGERVIYDRLVY